MSSRNGPYYGKLSHVSMSGDNCQYPDVDSTMGKYGFQTSNNMSMTALPFILFEKLEGRDCKEFDINLITGAGAQMYSLANGALEVHQNNSDRQLAGLLKAATAAANLDTTFIHNGTVTDGLELNVPGVMLPKESARSSSEAYPDDHIEKAVSDLPQHSQASTQVEGEATGIGAQSAAVLFRGPAPTSKKYTRPPMSKLYSSLELDPEKFLHLQSAAKTFMLDPAHPERRDCVGQRGKGDSEAVKMKLWNTVARFLDEEGHGHYHFGEHVLNEQGSPRSMIWSQDKSKIIGAVMPLLRRMVTNERQRQYAVETRKGATPGQDKKRKASDIARPLAGGSENFIDDLRLQLNVVQSDRRIYPKLLIPAKDCPDLQSVAIKAMTQYEDTFQHEVRISVLLPTGLACMQSNDDWAEALSRISEIEWMDREAKVIIEA